MCCQCKILNTRVSDLDLSRMIESQSAYRILYSFKVQFYVIVHSKSRVQSNLLYREERPPIVLVLPDTDQHDQSACDFTTEVKEGNVPLTPFSRFFRHFFRFVVTRTKEGFHMTPLPSYRLQYLISNSCKRKFQHGRRFVCVQRRENPIFLCECFTIFATTHMLSRRTCTTTINCTVCAGIIWRWNSFSLGNRENGGRCYSVTYSDQKETGFPPLTSLNVTNLGCCSSLPGIHD